MRFGTGGRGAWLPRALATLAIVPYAVAGVESPPVTVQLRAPWQKPALYNGGSPLILELLEAANAQEPSSFFALLDQLSEHHTAAALSSISDQELLETVQRLIDSNGLFSSVTAGSDSASATDLWKLSLALHDTSPRVQAFAQLYDTLNLDQRWKQRTSTAECTSWIDWNDQVLCTANEVEQALHTVSQTETRESTVRLLPFDHVRGSNVGQAPKETTFFLYADPYSENFAELHRSLSRQSNSGSDALRRASSAKTGITYVLRWRPTSHPQSASQPLLPSDSKPQSETVYLSGYGAILDLKKVDYLVIDDRKLRDDTEVGEQIGIDRPDISPQTHNKAADGASSDSHWLRAQIGASSHESDSSVAAGSLSDEEIAGLGLKAAELIIGSPDPLRALRELSQNFPSYAASLARSDKFAGHNAKELVEAVLDLGSRRIEPGGSEVWINGASTLRADFHPLKLLDVIRQERKIRRPLMHPLAGGGLNATEAIDLISSSLVGRAFSQSDLASTSATFDASDRIEKSTVEVDSKEPAPKGRNAGAIAWFNDLENDAETSSWSKSLMDLLRPMWPGQFPRLSVNLFNVVLVLDLSKRDTCRFLSETVAPSLGRVGLRWGLIPAGLEKGTDSDSAKMARLFWLVFDKAGPRVAADVLRRAAASPGGTRDRIDVTVAKKEARFALRDFDVGDNLDAELDVAISGQSNDQTYRERLVNAYVQRLRATEEESPAGHVFVNGRYHRFHPQITGILHQTVQEQIQTLAPQIYYGHVSAETANLDTYFYDAVGTLSFRSALVPDASSSTPGVAAGSGQTTTSAVRHASVDLFSALLDPSVANSDAEKVMHFIYPISVSDQSDDLVKPVNSTAWLLVDFDSPQGASLLQKGLQALSQPDAAFRLGLLHLPAKRASSDAGEPGLDIPLSALLYRLLQDGSIQKLSPLSLLEIVEYYINYTSESNLDSNGRIEERGSLQDLVQKVFALDDQDSSQSNPIKVASAKGWAIPAIVESSRFWTSIAEAVIPTLRPAERSASILVDGHLISDIDVAQIESRDITAVVQHEAAQKLPVVVEALQLLREDLFQWSPSRRQNLIFAATSVLNSVYNDDADQGMFVNKVTQRTGLPEQLGTSAHTFEIGDRDTAAIRIAMLLNPLSESAQKWSSILGMLSELSGVYVRVILNPPVKLREIPLKRFYRFSAPAQLQFDDVGKELTQELRFDGLPEDAVLTLGLDVPAPWLTMAEEAVYDLDNIRLSDVPSASRSRGVRAVYELKHILVEGHARQIDGASNSIPRGVQLLLETPDGDKRLDTIVMANLAYFQFKAQPGLWRLRIRPGRSDELYEMVSVGNEGWDSPPVEVTGNDITLDSLAGLTIYPRLRKRHGKEREELLEELDAQGRPVKRPRSAGGAASGSGVSGFASGLLSSARDTVSSLASRASSGFGTKSLSKSPHAEINIFTVASGHLYERMTYIMVLSVLKHTNSTVKFWFIENFLSPSFKEFIPHLAKEYRFEYELVTYAWPHWLRAQTEKQRTIWGYKILFLDTLFPLDLSKVIFVDADQVVRTDMKELVDLDLEGKVYGYPPMGDDSEDMDGFRFWKQGYWKDYLRGRPYHISALYVVDLQRFRRFAAGDRLRGQYQALSADPGSLSNLDQDLPNNMQASLPIHTLDKEWLWCETWCSKDWLDKAKTIDLCSNPKTKEPKLDRARRQIPEWTEYDEEVAKLAQRLVEEKRVGKNVVDPGQVVSKTPASHAFTSDAQPSTLSTPAADTGRHQDVVSSHDEL
ncbi:hypothetical protein BCV70DRAFT_200024 [Testicularia cyperi]|uniref:UDP-glucose:glyco protein glucosyltransferase n=1 Tax=Testicularia cyperi TaxID=1882483 RepID=A0A317XTY3_9BASI|nr:hypothetical protein BCV70DRAFT_200024 [Testicularia cyperi]